MPRLQLPYSRGCLVCGRDNPIGLQLTGFIDDVTGAVSTTFVPTAHHIGFHGVIHGGILATVLDEAMVWAATWAGKRFCLAAEMNVRFRSPARVGATLTVEAKLDYARTRLVTTTGLIRDGDTLIAEATGKYIPLPADENARFVATLVDDPASAEAAAMLRM